MPEYALITCELLNEIFERSYVYTLLVRSIDNAVLFPTSGIDTVQSLESCIKPPQLRQSTEISVNDDMLPLDFISIAMVVNLKILV